MKPAQNQMMQFIDEELGQQYTVGDEAWNNLPADSSFRRIHAWYAQPRTAPWDHTPRVVAFTKKNQLLVDGYLVDFTYFSREPTNDRPSLQHLATIWPEICAAAAQLDLLPWVYITGIVAGTVYVYFSYGRRQLKCCAFRANGGRLYFSGVQPININMTDEAAVRPALAGWAEETRNGDEYRRAIRKVQNEQLLQAARELVAQLGFADDLASALHKLGELRPVVDRLAALCGLQSQHDVVTDLRLVETALALRPDGPAVDALAANFAALGK